MGRAEAGRAEAGQAEVGRAEPWRGRGETVVGGDVAICGGTGRDVAERDLARRGACGVCVCVCVCMSALTFPGVSVCCVGPVVC